MPLLAVGRTCSSSASLMKPLPSASKCMNAASRFSRRCSLPRNTVAVRNSCAHGQQAAARRRVSPAKACAVQA